VDRGLKDQIDHYEPFLAAPADRRVAAEADVRTGLLDTLNAISGHCFIERVGANLASFSRGDDFYPLSITVALVSLMDHTSYIKISTPNFSPSG
jgi:hypothetical protein